MLAVGTALDAREWTTRQANAALKRAANGAGIEIRNVEHLNGLCAGLSHGEYLIKGNAGDYLGVLNNGAHIEVTGNTGNYCADNMTGGRVLVHGSTGYGAGLYPYAGALIVRGSAGDFTATMNKGAAIIICGDVGDEVATYHLGGDLVVLGNAGLNFGNFLIRGNLYLRGQCQSLGHNTREEEMTREDLQKLTRYFEEFDVDADPATFRKIVAKSQKPFYE